MPLTLQDLVSLLPLLVTAATAVVVMLAIAIRRHHDGNATLTVIGLNLALASVVLVALLRQPHTVTSLLVVDGYACFFMVLILASTLACATLAHAYLRQFEGNREEFYLLLVLAACGGIVLACSRHLASLFIGLELLSVPVYGMVAYTFRQSRSLEAGVKYLVLSASASAFLLFGMALLYAQSGTLEFAGLGAQLGASRAIDPVLMAGVGMLLVGLAFKLSLVPFHLWTPDVYEGAPAPVGAFLASASKVAVLAVLVRFIYATPAAHHLVVRELLAALAIASILFGNLLALQQSNLKRLLGYSSIAHFGYVLVAVVIGGNLGIQAIAIYMMVYVVATLAAFGAVALMSSPSGQDDADALFSYRGLFWQRPLLSSVLTVTLLSLAGIPMTAGFIGKFAVIMVGASQGLWLMLLVMVIGSAIGVFYYLRAMIALYMAVPGMRRHDVELGWGQRMGGIMVLAMAALMLLLGIYPQPALEVIRTMGILPL